MNDNVFMEQEAVILERKDAHEENSYTCYLFEKGIDKILKKVGEECTETVIAAKNLKAATEADDVQTLKSELVGEISDLIYHVQVMMCDVGVSMSDVLCEMDRRAQKTGNKKVMKQVDKNT